MENKGFTLIELLVVIAIVAVLSVVVILTLNPAELLRQARDSNRISDLNTLKSAISLYLVDVSTVTLAPSFTTCYMSSTPTSSRCGNTFTATHATASTTASAAVNGTGWVPVNFDAISTRSPISKLPIDPVNNTAQGFFYAYGATTTAFKLVANMESSKYAQSGGSDMESNSKDGGSVDTHFEVGSNLAL